MVAISRIVPDRERDEPEAELHRRPGPVDDASWAGVLEALPRLTDALDAGLRRGRPPG